jgi:hypothetical protein
MVGFDSYNENISPKESDKRVESVEIRLIVKDVTGEVGITDIMFQSGSISTVWNAHPSEIKWTVDG